MPINFNDVYEQRKKLEENVFQPKEAYNRLLISRGYYASFTHVCDLIKDKKNGTNVIFRDSKGDKYGSHQRYYESLIQSGDKTLASIGTKLRNYHKKRKIADYELKEYVKDLDVKIADQYLEECRALINLFLENK